MELSLNELVLNEAQKLLLYAESEELMNLDADLLNYDDAHLCIYGLLTGSCWSGRAAHLLNLCAVPCTRDLMRIVPAIHAKFERGSDRHVFSAIEHYITLPSSNCDKLVGFLRGEIKELSISDL